MVTVRVERRKFREAALLGSLFFVHLSAFLLVAEKAGAGQDDSRDAPEKEFHRDRSCDSECLFPSRQIRNTIRLLV
jgi:hypothetical protein